MKNKFALAAVLAAGLWQVAPAHAALPTGKIVATGCLQSINMGKDWHLDSPDVGGHGGFSAGIGANASLTGDCKEIAANLGASVRAKVFGIGGLVPLSIGLKGSTNNVHHTALTFGIRTFGMDIYSKELADSDQALSDGGTFGQMLPGGIATNNFGGSLGIPHTDYKVSYTVGYDLVGTISGFYYYDVRPDHVKAQFWGYVDTHAHLQASGTFDVGDDASATLTGTANVTILKGTAEAMGEFKQASISPPNAPPNAMYFIRPIGPPTPWQNNAWQVTGHAAYSISKPLYGSLNGHLHAKVRNPLASDDAPDDEKYFTIDEDHTLFSLDAHIDAQAQNWDLVKTYYKPFN